MLTMTSVVSFRSLQITRRKASLAWLPPLRLEVLTVVAAVAAEECAADELDCRSCATIVTIVYCCPMALHLCGREDERERLAVFWHM